MLGTLLALVLMMYVTSDTQTLKIHHCSSKGHRGKMVCALIICIQSRKLGNQSRQWPQH